MPGSACSRVGVGIAGNGFFAHRGPPRPWRGHLDADFLGPGQQDVVRRDGDFFEAGRAKRSRVHSASSRSRAEPATCGWSVSTRCASRMRSADGSARKRRSTLGCAAAPARVKPNGPASGRCQAAVAARRPPRPAPAPRRIGLVTLFKSLRISRAAFCPDPAGDAAARVRARAAQVESRDGRAVPGPTEDRAHREELIERRLAVEDVAAGQAVGRLEVERRDDLLVDRRAARCPARTRASVRRTICPSSAAASDHERPPASVYGANCT